MTDHHMQDCAGNPEEMHSLCRFPHKYMTLFSGKNGRERSPGGVFSLYFPMKRRNRVVFAGWGRPLVPRGSFQRELPESSGTEVGVEGIAGMGGSEIVDALPAGGPEEDGDVESDHPESGGVVVPEAAHGIGGEVDPDAIPQEDGLVLAGEEDSGFAPDRVLRLMRSRTASVSQRVVKWSSERGRHWLGGR